MEEQYTLDDEMNNPVDKTILELMLSDEPCCIYHEDNAMDEIAINFGKINGEIFIADIHKGVGYHIFTKGPKPKEVYESQCACHSEVDKMHLEPKYVTDASVEQIIKEFEEKGYEFPKKQSPKRGQEVILK